MKARVFINRQIVAANKRKSKETGVVHDEAAIAIQTYQGSIYAKEVEFINSVRLVQDAKNAICSGATIWLEADFQDIKIIAQ